MTSAMQNSEADPGRTADRVLERMITWANAQEIVRALILTGSRASPHATVDDLSDYDVEVYVTDVAPFARDETWARWFGEPMVMFRDDGDDRGPNGEPLNIARLVLYESGVRIDYSVGPASDLVDLASAPHLPNGLDSGYRVLLDKDGAASRLKPPTHTAYIRARPTPDAFRTLVDEFWWGTTYVAKYLRRDDLLPARYSLNGALDRLRQALEWQLEMEHNWSLPLGTRGRAFKRLLGAERWRELERALPGPSPQDHWNALFAVTALFGRTAAAVAAHLDYHYPLDLDRRVTAYLRELHSPSA